MQKSVNLKSSANSIDTLFQYLRVGTLNNHMLNVLRAENRTLDFHIHNQSDEMFYCIEGEFDIETEDGLTHLKGVKECSISAWEEKTRKIYSSFGKAKALKKVNYKIKQ